MRMVVAVVVERKLVSVGACKVATAVWRLIRSARPLLQRVHYGVVHPLGRGARYLERVVRGAAGGRRPPCWRHHAPPIGPLIVSWWGGLANGVVLVGAKNTFGGSFGGATWRGCGWADGIKPDDFRLVSVVRLTADFLRAGGFCSPKKAANFALNVGPRVMHVAVWIVVASGAGRAVQPRLAPILGWCARLIPALRKRRVPSPGGISRTGCVLQLPTRT